MIVRKSLFATLAIAACFATGAVYAGPAVTVTFMHVGSPDSDEAKYIVTNSNETSTNLNASPKPDTSVDTGASDSYRVQSNISPDMNYASVRYTIGSKTCAFSTTYSNTIGAGGVKVPKWNKSATPSGGATCTATLTSTNFSTHEWAVQFTMK